MGYRGDNFSFPACAARDRRFNGAGEDRLRGAGEGSTTTLVIDAPAIGDSGFSWQRLLQAIQEECEGTGKTVALDLSASRLAVKDGVFDPRKPDGGVYGTGEGYIRELTLPEGADRVASGRAGAGTFSAFTALEGITGKKVRNIGAYAFQGCMALVRAEFPAARYMGNSVFYNCPNLIRVEFPLMSGSIGAYAFQNCVRLIRAEFPLMSGSIGNYAFQGTGLSAAEFPAAKSIGDRAFYNCKNLITATFPLMSGNIGAGAFQNTPLITAYFPVMTGNIGAGAFKDCVWLGAVEFPAARFIGNRAFQGTGLSAAEFPVAKTIGKSAFKGCVMLERAGFPAAKAVGDRAFQGCVMLRDVDIRTVTGEGVGLDAFSTDALTVDEGEDSIVTIRIGADVEFSGDSFRHEFLRFYNGGEDGRGGAKAPRAAGVYTCGSGDGFKWSWEPVPVSFDSY